MINCSAGYDPFLVFNLKLGCQSWNPLAEFLDPSLCNSSSKTTWNKHFPCSTPMLKCVFIFTIFLSMLNYDIFPIPCLGGWVWFTSLLYHLYIVLLAIQVYYILGSQEHVARSVFPQNTTRVTWAKERQYVWTVVSPSSWMYKTEQGRNWQQSFNKNKQQWLKTKVDICN